MNCKCILPAAGLMAVASFSVPFFINNSPASAGMPAGTVNAAVEDIHYTIDAGHSAVNFRVKHLGVSHAHGRFNKMSGKLVFDPAKPEASSIQIEIQADSVDSNNEGRDKHLRNSDFFNAKQFPIISFKSTGVRKTSGNKYEITGDMTLRGTTKKVTAQADHVGEGKDPWGGFRTGFDVSFVIKRSEFGINYMPEGLGDEVFVQMGVEATRDKK